MVLLGTVCGIMAAGRGRLDRSWLCFGAGIAVFAVADSIYLVQIAKGTYIDGTLLDVGWLLGALLVGLAAWQPEVRTRRTGDELPSIIVPIGFALASLSLLMYDRFEPTNTLALGLAAGTLVAILVRLSLTHRDSLANLLEHAWAGAHRLIDGARESLRIASGTRSGTGRACTACAADARS